MFVKVLQNKRWRTILEEILVSPFRKQKISQVGFVRLAVIRLESPELDFLFIKPAFKKVSTTMIAFGFFKTTECPHHLMVPRQGNTMAETPASLIPSSWSLIILRNSDATTIPRSFRFVWVSLPRTTAKLNFSQNPWEETPRHPFRLLLH